MTYVRKGWDVYAGTFIFRIQEFLDNVNVTKTLIEEQYYLHVILFQADSPEAAYEWAVDYVGDLDSDHDGKYDLRETTCVGLYDLDNTQTQTEDVPTELRRSYGFSTAIRDVSTNHKRLHQEIPKREELTLFQID